MIFCNTFIFKKNNWFCKQYYEGDNMNKLDLISTLKQEGNISKAEAAKVVEIFFDSMSEALIEGERIEIRGLCSFFVKNYKSYVGRNPKTGEKVSIRPKKLPFFKSGKELKERVDYIARGLKECQDKRGDGSLVAFPYSRELEADIRSNKVETIEMVVVLPAPFGPNKLKISPSWISNEIPLTAVKSPNFLTRFRTSRMGGMAAPV